MFLRIKHGNHYFVANHKDKLSLIGVPMRLNDILFGHVNFEIVGLNRRKLRAKQLGNVIISRKMSMKGLSFTIIGLWGY